MKTSGVYVLYGKRDQCLYVGSSLNMGERVSMHIDKHFSRVAYFPCSAELRLQEEYKMIAALKPLLNKQMNSTMRRREVLQFSVNSDDKRMLQKLQKKLAGIGNTAIFRLAIRALEEKLAA